MKRLSEKAQRMKRGFVMVVVMLGALVLGSGLALEAASAKDSSARDGSEVGALATRVVTRTFSNNGLIAIPDDGQATPYPSTTNVSGLRRGSIRDVNLTLRNYSVGGCADDVEVLLVGPRGRQVSGVVSDVGGTLNLVNNLTLVLDDEAAGPLPDEEQITGGRFVPSQGTGTFTLPAPAPPAPYSRPLSVFDGTNPNGTWSLFVFDDNGNCSTSPHQITGGWSLTIRARVLR